MTEKREDSNEKLQLYHVKDEYVEYLRKHEKRVWTNSDKGYQRPYVGIVIEIDGHKYYAPLTSAKPKHEKWKDSLTNIRIEYKSELIAILCLNNMIPVSDKDVNQVDIKSYPDENYKNVLNKEMIGIRHKQEKIIKTARNLYNEIGRKDNPKPFIQKIRAICFDFQMLKTKCDEYSSK